MAVKKQNTTLAKAREDEQIFVLRGQDLTSPQTICFWIMSNINNEQCPDAKLEEALECALAMRRESVRRAAD